MSYAAYSGPIQAFAGPPHEGPIEAFAGPAHEGPIQAFAGWFDPEAHDYMVQVDADVDALDRDIQTQFQKLNVGMAFFGAWNSFANDIPGSPEIPSGWRYYRSHLTRFREIISKDQVMTEIGGYQRSLHDFYKKFVEAGGVPTNPEPTLGFDPEVAAKAAEKRPTPWYETAAKGAIVLGSIFAVGYLLHGFGEAGAVLQKAGIFQERKRR
jgi:hypothetical protein